MHDFNTEILFLGYNTVLKIPAGASNIYVLQHGIENGTDDNYLGMIFIFISIVNEIFLICSILFKNIFKPFSVFPFISFKLRKGKKSQRVMFSNYHYYLNYLIYNTVILQNIFHEDEEHKLSYV